MARGATGTCEVLDLELPDLHTEGALIPHCIA